MNREVTLHRNRDVRRVFDVGQERPQTHLNREADHGDGEVVGIVQIPAILKDKVDSGRGISGDVDAAGLDGVQDGGVELELGGAGVDEEGDEEGEEEDDADGDEDVEGRAFGLESLIGEGDQRDQLVLARARIDAPLTATSRAIHVDSFLVVLGVAVELLIATQALQLVVGAHD